MSLVIEVLKGFPDNIAAYACHEHLTKADYEKVLIPDIEDRLSRHQKLRIYCEISPDYAGVEPGAMWDDWKFGFSTWFEWERGALVTDSEWMSRATRWFGLLVPGEWRAFPTAQAGKAREWILENQGSVS